MTDTIPPSHRLARQPWTPASPPAAHPTAASPPRQPVSGDRSRLGEPTGVPISASCSEAAPTTTPVYQAFNWSAGVYTGHHGSETTAPPVRPWQGPPRSHGMLPSADTTWAITSHDQDEAIVLRHAAHLPGQLVPQRRRRPLPVAGLRREHARPQMDCRPIHGRAKGRETPIAGSPTSKTCTGWHGPIRGRTARHLRPAPAGRYRAWKRESWTGRAVHRPPTLPPNDLPARAPHLPL